MSSGRRWRWIDRKAVVRLAVLFVILLVPPYCVMIRMPGSSYDGPLPDPDAALVRRLESDVRLLAEDIGERNVKDPEALARAADTLALAFTEEGYEVSREAYIASGVSCENIVAERKGEARPDEIWVVGAHYDSVFLCTGANDNASGVAALLALARSFAASRTAATIRFVAFVNEEPPHFQTEAMGSLVHARRCRERGETIAGAISLETMGYFSDVEGSQNYPFPLGAMYPSTGNFIGFVGNVASRAWVRRVIGLFREHGRFPSEGAALPETLPGVGWSDHWSFAQEGWPALMVTDTAPFRYPYYHTRQDTPEKLDYRRMAIVVEGLDRVLREIVGAK